MNRQRIRVIVLATLLVAGGAYVWAQRTASAVKPAQTSNAAVNKPANVTQPAKPAASPANATSPSAATPVSATRAANPAVVPAAKTPASLPVATSKPAPAVDAKPAISASVKTTPVPAAAATAAAVEPAAPLASWQDSLMKGSYLAEKLRPRLPQGTEPIVASLGFRDLHQFVATVNASHNLKLDFEELKRRVVTDRKGLATAIDAMKKVASATIEEQRAEYEARGLIQEARRQPPPPPVAAKTAATKPQPKKPFRAQIGS